MVLRGAIHSRCGGAGRPGERPDLATKVKLNVGFPEQGAAGCHAPFRRGGAGPGRVHPHRPGGRPSPGPPLLRGPAALRRRRGSWPPVLAPFDERIQARGPEGARCDLLGAIERRTPSYGDKRRVLRGPGESTAWRSDLRRLPPPARAGAPLGPQVQRVPGPAGGPALRAPGGEPDDRMAGCVPVRGPPLPPRPSTWSATRCGSVRQEMGLDNLQLMVPFCRTPEEGRPGAVRRSTSGVSRPRPACPSS